MLDKILQAVLGDKMKNCTSITIEMGNDKEKEEMEKEGMAPPLKEKDAQVKGTEDGDPSPLLANNDEAAPEDDDELMGSLMSDRDAQGHLNMAAEGKKPKGIFNKGNQELVTKRYLKNNKA